MLMAAVLFQLLAEICLPMLLGFRLLVIVLLLQWQMVYFPRDWEFNFFKELLRVLHFLAGWVFIQLTRASQ